MAAAFLFLWRIVAMLKAGGESAMKSWQGVFVTVLVTSVAMVAVARAEKAEPVKVAMKTSDGREL